jgi:hypothetical protein
MSVPATAGFLDERSAQVAAPAVQVAAAPASPRPALKGFGPAWASQLQASAKRVPLHIALRILRPPSESPEIVLDQGLKDLEVTWGAGASRLDVLSEFASANHLIMTLEGNRLVVVKNEAAAVAARQALASVFAVTTADRSVREVLARWARGAGWAHEPSHWTLDRDHPIQGAAGPEIFGTDFKTAARKLLSSTELTDRPVQPCFYLNKVVRVIPRAELCDRTQP